MTKIKGNSKKCTVKWTKRNRLNEEKKNKKKTSEKEFKNDRPSYTLNRALNSLGDLKIRSINGKIEIIDPHSGRTLATAKRRRFALKKAMKNCPYD